MARLPARPGVLAVKRVTGCWDGWCWLEGDNLAASTDSWQVGAVATDDVLAWVLVRYRPRPGLLAAPRSGRLGGFGHRRPGGIGYSRAASDSSSAR